MKRSLKYGIFQVSSARWMDDSEQYVFIKFGRYKY